MTVGKKCSCAFALVDCAPPESKCLVLGINLFFQADFEKTLSEAAEDVLAMYPPEVF